MTPPDTCPICGAMVEPSSGSFPAHWKRIDFGCGLLWLGMEGQYHGDCENATAAALRCIELLHRLRQWEKMNSADGPYWQAEIDKALRP